MKLKKRAELQRDLHVKKQARGNGKELMNEYWTIDIVSGVADAVYPICWARYAGASQDNAAAGSEEQISRSDGD